jgi:pyruvate/2-oxoglutarate dehydrogenase complex dihydrolipoamide acyltransferase (E2) component
VAAAGSASLASAAAPAAAPAAVPAAASKAAASSGASAPRPSGDRVVASPMAKSLAAERGINLGDVAGTGPEGRITAADVENFKAPAKGAKDAGKPAENKPEGPKLDRTGGGVIPAGTVIASPEAKKLAKKNKVDIAKLVGSGAFGRVTPEDVLAAAGKAPAAPKKALATPTRAIPDLPDGPVKMSGMQVSPTLPLPSPPHSPCLACSCRALSEL